MIPHDYVNIDTRPTAREQLSKAGEFLAGIGMICCLIAGSIVLALLGA